MEEKTPNSTSPAVQFDQAEFDQPAGGGASCVLCKKPVGEAYYEINGHLACPACRQNCVTAMTGGSGAWRFLKALALGVGAAVLGAVIWYAVTVVTGYELGLIAVVVGLLVGFAVRKGSEGRGGWLYQLLAILLTYSSIVSTYVPHMLPGLDGPEPSEYSAQSASPQDPAAKAAKTVVMVVLCFFLAFAVPFLAGIENAIGLLIIGFALYEAWKINKRVPLQITGPYQVAHTGVPPPQPPPLTS